MRFSWRLPLAAERKLLRSSSIRLDRPRSGSATATQPTEAWRIERIAFQRALEGREAWAVIAAVTLAKGIAGRFVSLDRELVAALAWIEGDPGAAQPVADLERLREHLASSWGF